MTIIRSKYLPPTNTKGARISTTDSNGGKLITPYDHAVTNAHESAIMRHAQTLYRPERLITIYTGHGTYAAAVFHVDDYDEFTDVPKATR